jgi:hypothetical protein
MPSPCRSDKCLDCLYHLIYTVRPCLIRSYHAAPLPCHDHESESDFSRPRHSAAWAWLGMCGLSSPSRDGMWAIFPRSTSSGYHAEFHEGCYQKPTKPLNCRTSSSDISGYHADFHQGRGTVGEWEGRGMACVN